MIRYNAFKDICVDLSYSFTIRQKSIHTIFLRVRNIREVKKPVLSKIGKKKFIFGCQVNAASLCFDFCVAKGVEVTNEYLTRILFCTMNDR